MPKILSISTVTPRHTVKQEEAARLTEQLFHDKFDQIERLLRVFQNGEIETRHVTMPLEWFGEKHDFEERNNLYIEHAVKYGIDAINHCLSNAVFLRDKVDPAAIDAIFFVSSSGISTPSIDARIMNHIPFRDDMRRVPIWGLGCAGGASGLSRAYDYCLAHPEANVLLLCVELCSLTFQKDDYTKSNLVGASLFADGIACALIGGEKSSIKTVQAVPVIEATASKWMPNSEDVMGWDVQNSGLHVIFSKSIPSIITNWLGPVVHEFLEKNGYTTDDISHFVAHPGGKKVLEAYEDALGFDPSMLSISRLVLRENGNMSSPTVLFVLEEFMKRHTNHDDLGLLAALGPGFCGELLLLKWEEAS